MVVVKKKAAAGGRTPLVILVAAVLVICILSLLNFGPSFGTQPPLPASAPQKTVDSSSAHNSDIITSSDFSLHELPDERLFQSASHGKSCLPSKNNPNNKCKEYIPPPPEDGSGDVRPRQRIALLAPPGQLHKAVLHVMQAIASHHNKQQPQQKPLMTVIESTHVPPYGYGKTHGLTKIIRLLPHPLTLEVANILESNELAEFRQSMMQESETKMQDLRMVLRQILRFHCRLSHVSAHTALLTIDTEQIATAPDKVVEQLVEFLSPINAQALLDSSSLLQQLLQDFSNTKSSIEIVAAKQILGGGSGDDNTMDALYQDLNQVLVEEMHFTKNLTAWPCPSFWAASSTEYHAVWPLSPLTKRLAQALAPNCSDPLASCFVLRDMCEEAGDAICNTVKKKRDREQQQQQKTH